MSGLFSSPSTPSIPPPKPPPGRSDEEVQAAALAERRRRQNARGRSSTILTDSSPAQQGRDKTLLGQ
jgi:hypothetical protein